MGKLLVGAAKKDITPTMEQLFAISKSEEGKPMANCYDGIHEHCFVRIIAVGNGEETALIVGYDLGWAPLCGVLTRRFEKELGIKPENSVFSATHNHEPVNPRLEEDDDYAVRDMPPVDPALQAYSECFVETVVECAKEAVAAMKPGKVGFRKGTSYINANRDFPTPIGPIQANNFHGPSDHELLLIQFVDEEGEIVAQFVNFACHSNAMVWNVYNRTYPKIGVDLGGSISSFVEKLHKGAFPVIWAQGAAADQNPITRSVWRILDVDEDGDLTYYQHVFNYKDNLEMLKSLAGTQALEIEELSAAVDNYTDELCFAGADTWRSIPGRVPYRNLGIYGDMSPVHKKDLPELKYQIKVGDFPEQVPLGKDVKLHFRMFTLTKDISFASCSCEANCTLGLIIKDMMPTEATAVCSISFGNSGYIMDKDNEFRNGYSTSGSFAWSGEKVNEAFISGYGELKEKIFG